MSNNLQVFEQAEILKRLQDTLAELDIEYLEEAHERLKDQASFRESAMVLNPNPLTAMDKADLDRCKLKQLRLYLDAAKGLQDIALLEIKLKAAQANNQKLKDMFGF